MSWKLCRGDSLAQADLGSVQRDLVFAFMWFTISATQGNETALTNRGAIEQWLTPAQVTEAERLSQEWIERHAQKVSDPSETIRAPIRAR